MFWNKYTKRAIFWMLVASFLKASPTIWSYFLLEEAESISVLMVICTICSYIAAIIPEILYFTDIDRAEFEATKKYVELFSENHKDSPEFMLDKDFRDKQEPLLTTENRKLIREALVVMQNGVTSSSSILIDVVLMSSFVSPLYLLGYVCGSLLYTKSLAYFKEKNDKISSKVLDKNKALTNILQGGWDNIVTGNKSSFKLWLSRFFNAWHDCRDSVVENAIFMRISGSVGTLIAALPIFGTTVYLFYSYSNDMKQTALLFAILPRQLANIPSYNLVSSSFTRWKGISKQLNDLSLSLLKPYTHTNPGYNIKFNGLSFSENDNMAFFKSPEEFISHVITKKIGRITIRGKNGKGKSVLMCKLNCELLEQNKETFYLPNKSRLSFDPPTEKLSSGEKTKEELKQILNDKTLNYILLDEWDANLDRENMIQISQIIEEAAKNRCIIEIRHRTDNEVELEKENNSSAEQIIPIHFNKNRKNNYNIKEFTQFSVFQSLFNRETHAKEALTNTSIISSFKKQA